MLMRQQRANLNRLSINFDKTLRILSTNHVDGNPMAVFKNDIIAYDSTGNLLGVLVNNNNLFVKHVIKMCSKISKSIRILYKL